MQWCDLAKFRQQEVNTISAVRRLVIEPYSSGQERSSTAHLNTVQLNVLLCFCRVECSGCEVLSKMASNLFYTWIHLFSVFKLLMSDLLLCWNENLQPYWPFVDKIGQSCCKLEPGPWTKRLGLEQLWHMSWGSPSWMCKCCMCCHE